MIDVLLLRFDAPLLSFGAPVVDNRGAIQDHPPLSMLTGLLGNALGYRHGEPERLQDLQSRIRYAARCDRSGRRLTDFQTVDLGQPALQKAGWTTRDRREDRRGGKASTGTHIRYREYLADSVYTIALTLSPPEDEPNVETLKRALMRPARPLFLGRKTCLPSVPLLAGRVQVPSLVRALEKWPLSPRADSDSTQGVVQAWWPDDETEQRPTSRRISVADRRDWHNRIHSGRRYMRHGRISVSSEGEDDG